MLDTQSARDLTDFVKAIISVHDAQQDEIIQQLQAWIVFLGFVALAATAGIVKIWIDIRNGRWVEDSNWKERHRR